jgi:Domain of unknown function (DUF6265)
MRWSVASSIAAAASVVIAGVAVTQSKIGEGRAPGWMTGCWLQETGENWTEECWMAPRGGLMLGAGRSGSGETLRNWEATQILAGKDGKLAFWASPNGGPRVGFPEVSRQGNEIVFANPKHDYPQRIRYWKQGDALNAETSLLDGSKAMRWRYRRVQ